MKQNLLFLIVFILFSISIAAAEDETRRIWAEAFIKKEEKPPVKKEEQAAPAKKTKPAPASKPDKKPEYKVTTPEVVTENVAQESVVGITIWRFRPAEEDEAGILIGNERLSAERVEGNRILSKGDRVRIAIEAARDGYLYVLNREQYRDGTTGEPYLIFPTARLTSGYNRTTLGRMIVIPGESDKPPYFTLTPGRPDQIAEILSVFITPEPLQELNIGNQPARISAAQVATWEKQWGKAVGRLELEGGAGSTLTSVEQQAGEGSRLLKHTDPAPQSLYYNPDLKSSDPVFVNVNLQYEPAIE
ncbi:DUF4384 domain-containing protein [bacterium]|nr:DUF4384 domain-containing protein [bacterium]